MNNQKIEEILDDLDFEQRKAATTLDGPLYILAGAGAGKTRTITHRIAYAVKSKYWAPSAILATTFTTKAAREMKDRLEQLGIIGATINTFHGASLALIKKYWHYITVYPFPEILNSKFSLLENICKQTGFSFSSYQISSISEEISWVKTSLLPIENYKDNTNWKNRDILQFLPADQFIQIYKIYEAHKAKMNKIDFEDILLIMVHAIDQFPRVASEIRQNYRYFIVDEFQDISPLQYYVLRMWMGHNLNICVVGDPSQTIYSFAGASCYYLNNFDKLFPGAKHVKIIKNYRSDKQIVQLANKILLKKRNKDYQQLKLESGKLSRDFKNINCLNFDIYKNEKQEAQNVISKIKKIIEEGYKMSDIAILYRAKFQARNVLQEAEKANLPFVERGQEGFFETPLINLILNNIKKNKVFYTKNYPSFGEYANNFQKRIDKTIFEAIELKEKKDFSRNVILGKAFSNLVKDFFQIDSTSRQDYSIDSFLEYIYELANQEIEPELDCITLASIHSSKGLEFACVFLIGMSDGNMPISLANSKEEIEEERRLLYVAITRAKQILFISYSAFCNNKKVSLSRFFEKIWPST
ncbi:MAG: ATP-dependent helicase [Bifidobacteriaceae bacterium]|jgi:DNA helicase-2/ATP-dependent DNA helicase PcrA|nr:ATP-dependent helicase [Bifidobacteriaceae bacterium]